MPSETKGAISSYLGTGFRNTVNALKDQKHAIKQQMKSVAEGTPEYEKLTQDLTTVNQALYHCILTRSMDIIAEKEWQVRQTGLDPMQKDALEYDIVKLNEKFAKTLEKYIEYKDTSTRSFSLKEAVLQQAKNAGHNIASNVLGNVLVFGFYTGKTDSPEEILAKKRYADMGYSMMNYMPQWLDSIHLQNDQTILTFVTAQVNEFLKWAEKHPEKASMMASDMSLTIMLLSNGNQAMVDHFRTQMEARAYAMAFVAPLGGPMWEEVEIEEELKYRALADFSRYTCAAAGAGVHVMNELWNGTLNPVQLIKAAMVGAGRAAFLQKAGDLIPSYAVQAAAAVSSVIKGEGYRNVMETQRSIELTRLAGITRFAIMNPERLLDSIKLNITMWWETINQAPTLEKATRILIQVVVPAAGVVAGLGLITLAIVGGPISLGIALGIAITCFLFSGSVIWNTNSLLNTIFPTTYNKVFADMTDNAKEKAKVQLLTDHRAQITAIRNNYIKDLQAARQLPYIRAPKKVTLTPVQNKAVESIVAKMKAQVLKNMSPIIIDPVKELNENFVLDDALKDAMNQINANPDFNMRLFDRANVAGYICAQVSSQLINEWLSPRLDDRLVGRAVNTPDAEIAKLPTYKNEEERVQGMKAEAGVYVKQQLQATKKMTPADAKKAIEELGNLWEENRAELAAPAA